MTEITSFFVDGFKLPSNARYLIGVPSIGNVGQSVKYVGNLESDLVLPMTGYERLGAAEKPKLCMPIEVYEVVGKNLFIVLQRSLSIKGTQKQFSASLLRWLQAVSFECAVVLTGASTDEIELMNSRIFHASASKSNLSSLESLFDASTFIPASSSAVGHPAPFAVEIDDLMNIPTQYSAESSTLPLGMTTARYLLESSLTTESSDAANKSSPGQVVVLGKFVSEGDNIGDGLDLALRVLNGFILAGQESVTARSLVHPESWSRRYGGGLRDATMFN